MGLRYVKYFLGLIALSAVCIFLPENIKTEEKKVTVEEKEKNPDELTSNERIEEDLINKQKEKVEIKNISRAIEYVEKPNDWIYQFDFNKSHPFENQCRYPVIRHDDIQISKYNSHYHKMDCSKTFNQPPLVHQHRNGEILVGRPSRYQLKQNFKCYFREIYGTLRPHKTYIKQMGKWEELPIGKRILIQKDQFLIRCLNDTDHVIYLNVFSWVSDKPHLNPPDVSKEENKFSISILAIESTARNQFYRHMPLTLKFLKERDFQILTGYNKVGDNSAINIMPVLSGLIFEKSERGFENLIDEKEAEFDPEKYEADFSKVNLTLIKRAQNAGCVTMWNDVIGDPVRGGFHYHIFNGFEKPIANYYYRPYYEFVYKRLRGAAGCYNGRPHYPKWLGLWEQFETKYSDKCHFGFSFIGGLTHAIPNNLELYDVHISDALLRMESAKVFDNTFVIIMGDHGQRMSMIQKSTIGRIEERMTFFSMHVPEKFKKLYPKKYENLLINQHRLTSNFDIHETLDEILSTTLNENVQQTKKHGISLFDEIPKDRTCKDALIPENFCTCMDKIEEEEIPKIDNLKESLKEVLTEYLNKTKDSCVQKFKFTISSKIDWYSINKMVRAGVKYPKDWDNVKDKDGIKRELSFIEITLDIEMTIDGEVKKAELLAIVQYNKDKKLFQINSPPQLKSKECPDFNIINNICDCY